MSLASSSAPLHKPSLVDIKYLRAMLKVKSWLRTNVTPTLHDRPKATESLSSGARVSDQDADGNTALHVAFLKFGDALAVDMLMGDYLLETTRNLVNGDGLSVVHILCTRSYTQLLETVLAGGRVNINQKVHRNSALMYAGYTPLHFAVESEQREVAELLLARYDANLYEQDAKGSTPLHLALESGNLAMLDLLLAYDSRRENVVNNRGLSHFMAACAGTDELAVKDYLRAIPSHELRTLICSTVANVDGYRFAGYTPLHFAVDFERSNVAALLVATTRELTPADLASSHRGSAEDLSSGSSESLCGFELPTFVMSFVLAFPMIWLLLTIVMFSGSLF